VPYGWKEENFGTCGKKCPWRGGANENTVVRFSHDVKVEGKPLAAGAYGLHFVPGETEWIVIFSKNSTSWGSYTYDEREDALRVTVKPEKAPYREWLAYDFLALVWEEMRVPVAIDLPNASELYAETLREELRSAPGFDWHGWQQAADYLVQQKIHLDEAEQWARTAITLPGIGEENFNTVSSLAAAQKALGKETESKATMEKALALPNTTPFDIYSYARPMIRDGNPQEALRIFQAASKRLSGKWPIDLGIARAYSAMGDYKTALKYAKTSLAVVPDDVNRGNVTRMIGLLENGQDMNK